MQQRVPWRLSFNTSLSCIWLAKSIPRAKTQKELLQLQYSCVILQSLIYKYPFTRFYFFHFPYTTHSHNFCKHHYSSFIQLIQELELEKENSQDSMFTFFHFMMLLELEQRKRELVEICHIQKSPMCRKNPACVVIGNRKGTSWFLMAPLKLAVNASAGINM